MVNIVPIGGANVDADDPCALYAALYAAKIKLLAGDHIEETEIRSPVTQRRIRVSVANMKMLDEELTRLSAACTLKTTGKRGRFAKRIRFTC